MQTNIFLVFITLNIDDYSLQLMKIQISQSLKISILIISFTMKDCWAADAEPLVKSLHITGLCWPVLNTTNPMGDDILEFDMCDHNIINKLKKLLTIYILCNFTKQYLPI